METTMMEMTMTLDKDQQIKNLRGRSKFLHELTVDLRRNLAKWKDEDDAMNDHGWHHDITWRVEAVQMLILDIQKGLEALDDDGERR
jgi:hypothetical protein